MRGPGRANTGENSAPLKNAITLPKKKAKPRINSAGCWSVAKGLRFAGANFTAGGCEFLRMERVGRAT